MSRARLILVALLVASTALFAIAVIAERSQVDEHAEPASAKATHSGDSASEPEEAHEDGEPDSGGASAEDRADDDEAVLGVTSSPHH